jgi:type IV pilus assembly protein PilY1
MQSPLNLIHRPQWFHKLRQAAVCAVTATLATATLATTPLADQPVFSTSSVPGNLALTLSVEFPTAVSVAHTDSTYSAANRYLGYFDPDKCYLYSYSNTEANRHFYPAGAASSRECTGTNDSKWSGNFLNWATMQTIDPFRWVMTGGYRSTDTTSLTILEKAWASGQGGGNFPNRTVTDSTTVANATPFGWSSFRMRIQGLGNKMRFTRTGDVDDSPDPYNPANSTSSGSVWEVSVRVKVCDASSGAGPLEPNCQLYSSGNHKPIGLMQQYADQIRYSAFGYLNDSNIYRDGAVLRARQKFIGPTQPVPGSTAIANGAAEWDASTGVFIVNPDASDASATSSGLNVSVSNSGVLNYLNKFGQINPGNYKSYDPVGELYYAALRYYKKLGNVPEWSAMGSADSDTRNRWVDGFPVITNWDDPIQYSCQKNFILGIGDVNTHADRNLPGASGGTEPSKPSSVSADGTVDAVTATNKVGSLHGLGASLGNTQNYNGCCNNNGALMAGLAYDANTRDIRPDDASDLLRTKGRQSVQTYWLDVLEYQTFKANNQFYLASKYGGFNVPEGYDTYGRSTDIPESWWRTNTDTVGSQPRPDTYFIASRPDQVVQGLTQAFASIASRMKAYTTSFATSLPQVATSGVASYSTQYDSRSWAGELTASETSLDAESGAPSLSESWRFSAKLDSQASGTGWNTARIMATWNTTSLAGVPFRLASLSTAQQTALDTSYRSGSDAGDYLNYLRGDKTHERSSTSSGSAKAYRDRTTLLGDIGNFKARPVGRPDAPYSTSSNPGYSTFKSTWASRPTVVYLGTNAGVLHAVNGNLTGSNAGRELFAYVPGAAFLGGSGTASATGLQMIGKPTFQHYNFVDATPAVADVDLGRTVGGTGTDWRTLLIGGLGKGGKALYALDITNPAGVTSETELASRVLWEFTDADLGFTYGEPIVAKTRKHGWVVIVGSGYNNANGVGYLFIINPRTGALLEKISTGVGTSTNQAGLAHVQGFMLDRTDGTVDAVYAGDLLGNLWRWDLTAGSGTLPTPLRMALLRDSSGNPLPVTSRPLVVVHPDTGFRYVTVGTGRLLHSTDSGSTQSQRFFAYLDGNASRFNKSDGSQLPAGISYPITTAKLKPLTDLTAKVVLDLNTQMGWYIDFGTVAGSGSWRMISDASSFYGIVAFTVMQPGGSSNPCEPTGNSRVYAVDLGSGQSRLKSSGDAIAPFLATLPGVVTDLRFYSAAGKARLLAGTDTGATGSLPGGWGKTNTLRRLNWREIMLND